MKSNKFLAIFIVVFIVYFILDYIFSNAMLYIVGGIVGGAIGEMFKMIGIDAGIFLISIVWIALLIGGIVLFYRSQSSIFKYFLVVVIAVLLYIVDMIVGNIPYSENTDMKNIIVISNIVIGILIFFKSAILSSIIYTGIFKD